MLTKKQLDLLAFIHKRVQRDGVPPSFDEMKLALDLRSKSGIHRLITALEERGFIRRLAHRARAIEVVKLPESLGGPAGFTPRVIDGDTTLSPARPDLGLPEDPLVLLTDAELEDELLSTTADRLAQELSRALVQPRVDALLAEASRLQPSDPIAAREARVAAEILSN